MDAASRLSPARQMVGLIVMASASAGGHPNLRITLRRTRRVEPINIVVQPAISTLFLRERKPANQPVPTPTKYKLVILLNAAKVRRKLVLPRSAHSRSRGHRVVTFWPQLTADLRTGFGTAQTIRNDACG